jgi:hypothetical protein
MRKLVTTLMVCGGIAIWSVSAFAQSAELRPTTQPQSQPQGQQTFCYEEEGPAFCVPTREQRYEACSNLAVERGERLGSGGFERLVYECLTGTLGTEPH